MSVAVVTGAGRGFGREIAVRLARRSYEVLCTDIDEPGAAETAQLAGGGAWAMAHDVRDPGQHAAAARAAGERGRLDVWVNNAGVMRTERVWDHPDDDVRLMLDVNFYGVVWGSRAAVEAMRAAPGGDKHLINIGSLSSLTPVPGLAVYGATKHGVLGFTESLYGDLEMAGVPIAVHCVCPDGADTALVRQEADKEASAIIWSAPRMLSAQEVADETVALLDSKTLVKVIPRYRGWQARLGALVPRAGMKQAKMLHKLGERKREKERRGHG